MGIFDKKLRLDKDGGISLKIKPAYYEDEEKQKCRISKNVMDFLDLSEGDLIEIIGTKKLVIKCSQLDELESNEKFVRMDRFNRTILRADIGKKVSIRKINMDSERIITNSKTNRLESIKDPIEIAKIDKIEKERIAKIEADRIAKEEADKIKAIQDEEERLVREKEEEKILAGEGDFHDYSLDEENIICCAADCDVEVTFLEGKKCKMCEKPCCMEHLEYEKHNCIKTRHVPFIRKTWLRKYGLNISSGRFLVVCEDCHYVSEYGTLIEDAGDERIRHIETSGCNLKKVWLEEVEIPEKTHEDVNYEEIVPTDRILWVCSHCRPPQKFTDRSQYINHHFSHG